MADGSEEKKRARQWRDRAGTEWYVQRREGVHGLRDGWILRRVGYSFVAHAEVTDDPTGEQLQDWIDGHTRTKGGDTDGTTVRLWTDPRDRTEWEIHQDAGELVFQRGIEAFRVERGDGRTPPRSMDDAELQAALDRAQGGT